MPFANPGCEPTLDTTMDFARLARGSIAFPDDQGRMHLTFMVDSPPPSIRPLMPSHEAIQADAEDLARVLFGADHGFATVGYEFLDA